MYLRKHRQVGIPLHSVRNALVLAIPERQIHVLQALRRCALEEVVDGGVDYDALAGAVYCEAADFDAVLAGNVADERGLANDLDKLLAGIAVLVDVADVSRGHSPVERDRNGVLVSVSMEWLGGECMEEDLREYPETTRRRAG